MEVALPTHVRPQVFVLDFDGHSLTLLNRVFNPLDVFGESESLCPAGPGIPASRPRNWDVHVESVANLEVLLSSTASIFGSIGVVDFGSNWTHRVKETLSQWLGSPQRVRHSILIAIGPRQLQRIEQELQIAGFAMVVSSKSELGRIRPAARRYWQSLDWPRQNVEQWVSGNLPWFPNINQNG